ncbi:MAG: HlyC/CorC family transporter [Kordiimonadaceae bacterium]|nr:HlyC/CorC family transporter [Kordiimonadaceae bacterium]MBO6567398.1 HlyC/CorC family transporter [Kordiimonadaceae bacterium]MBO6963388.1 HlyC/CorC family transporter [Kordiimonadaceae bacterium]
MLLLFPGATYPALAAETLAPSPTQGDIILLAIFVMGALVFSFICSVAEAVLLSITPSFIEKIRAEQPERADALKALRQDNVDRSLAAILTVNTIAHTVGAIASGAQATVVFGSTWIGLFSGIMTLAILFLSEIIPKTIGAVYWTSLVGPTMVFIRLSIKLLYPLIWISEGLTKLIARGKPVHPFSRDEFLAMTNIGERSGEIKEHEARIVRNLIHFGSLTAEDIMTPRTVVAALQQDTVVSDAATEMLTHAFSRFPVFGKDIDDIVGLVLRDEILALEAKDEGDKPLSAVKRDIQHIEADISLPALLEHFLDSRQHIALVVDTYGGTKGIVSLEDVIEALLGMEIMDEMDNVEDMRQLARKQWLARAKKLGIDPE